MNQQIVDLEIDSLQPNPLQPRGIITPESLVDLVDSVREHGILEPLVVAKTPAGYQIIAGERRWRASKLAGLKTVPVIIKETTPQGMLEMAIVENVQRTDLNPLDRAKAFDRLISEFGLGNSEIAQRISKSPAYVSNSMRLLTLPDALKDGLLTGLISEGHARALAAIDDTRLIVEAYKIILRESGSVRRAEELARKMRAQIGKKTKGKFTKAPHEVSEEIDRLRQEIEDALGGKPASQVRLSRSRAETRLTIILKGTLVETEERLQKISVPLVGNQSGSV
ncbi:MAG: ParB-like protein partition protein [Candidatus Gottesmanbacteria bacterium GW2011_GWA1_48_13]|uniref:ParB-like protein partition protein n=1 Tax=Candidatus Gottesmanbacteria bacterium GW2011_GWA1_48_13 TaxID=1618439 RepID=A0A0G1ULR8_9BACT|nr:MAG: ParB-like protein partition protein [Candidatus Gottesmanbacteria bacterium GW2011_GWA1_48_13]